MNFDTKKIIPAMQTASGTLADVRGGEGFSPLDQHRTAKVASGMFGWVQSGGWATTAPKGVAIGSLVRVRHAPDGKVRKDLEVKDETGRVIQLPTWHFDPGMEFHIQGVHGWFSESHPQVLDLLQAELDGAFQFPRFLRKDGQRRAIITRNSDLVWRGLRVKRW